jgi:hypothetical protein
MPDNLTAAVTATRATDSWGITVPTRGKAPRSRSEGWVDAFRGDQTGRPRPPHFQFDVTVGRSSAEGIVEDNVTIDIADGQLPPSDR